MSKVSIDCILVPFGKSPNFYVYLPKCALRDNEPRRVSDSLTMLMTRTTTPTSTITMTHLAIHSDSDNDNEPTTTRTKTPFQIFQDLPLGKDDHILALFPNFDEASFNVMMAMTQLFLIIQKELGVEMMKCEQWIVSVV